jgi:hypothetical protein
MQITNAKIEESILELLHQRAAGKTIQSRLLKKQLVRFACG